MSRQRLLRGDVDPVLTGVAVAFKFPENSGFSLFPVITHDRSDGKIAKFGKESFKLVNSSRAMGANTKHVTYAVEYVPVTLDRKSLANGVDRDEYSEAVDPVAKKLLLQKSRVNMLMGQIGIEIENQQATLAQNPANYDDDHKKKLDGTTNKKISDPNSDPIAYFDEAKEAIRASTGQYPNTCLISADVWVKLKRHPKMLTQVPVSQVQTLTINTLAEIIEIPRIVIAQSVFSQDGKNIKDIWRKSIILAYVPENPESTEEPAFGYSPRKEGYPIIESWYDEDSTSDIVRVEDYIGVHMACPEAGYLIFDAI
ncbi:MAG: hypothetical protein QXJ28_02740 [Candidatus Pacearchaeota archaeon]